MDKATRALQDAVTMLFDAQRDQDQLRIEAALRAIEHAKFAADLAAAADRANSVYDRIRDDRAARDRDALPNKAHA